jgi:hypothetical protein
MQRRVPHAEVDAAEERIKGTVGAEPVVHRLRVRPGLVHEPIVEPEDAQVLRVERMAHRQQPAVLGVEDEHQPQDHVEHALVHVALLHGRAHPVRGTAGAVSRCGRLETREQRLDGLEHLLGELFGDVRLPPSALRK